MYYIYSKKSSTIVLDSNIPEKNINMLREYIKKYECSNMTIDITKMNIIDACYLSTVCSTEHYLKYPEGKITWITNSEKVKEYSSNMSLGNNEFIKQAELIENIS